MLDRRSISSIFPLAATAVLTLALPESPAAAASPPAGQRPFTPIAGGTNHTCTLSSDGSVLCWGQNTSGQLGNGTTTNSALPTAVSGLSHAVSVAAGGSHTCAIEYDGRVSCWGSNAYGQLGDGTFTSSNTPVTVEGIGGASMPALTITAGATHTCAVLTDGTAKCWGRNSTGQIGDGTTTHRNVPVTVPGLSELFWMSAGSSHTCAVSLAGEVSCWGANANGQLGDGTLTTRLSPVSVNGIAHGDSRLAIGISAGRNHTCAHVLTGPSIGGAPAAGTVACWGSNNRGQVGIASLAPNITAPHTVAVSNVKDISANGDHSCALLASGGLRCWGENADGEAGNGTSGGSDSDPAAVRLSGARALAAGYYHACAVLSNGTARCWGRNVLGQIGDGTWTNRPTPVGVSALPIVSNGGRIVNGVHQTCGLLGDGTVKCWGDNHCGELTEAAPIETDVPVLTDLAGVVDICAYERRACAVLADGTVKCWGGESLATSDCPPQSAPVAPVEGVSNAIAVTCSRYKACAILADGTVTCWLGNDYPPLSIPAQVVLSTGAAHDYVRTADGGLLQACSIRADGAVSCWHSNNSGPVPVALAGGLRARSLGLGHAHSCAVGSDGIPQFWGLDAPIQHPSQEELVVVPTPVIRPGFSGVPRVVAMAGGFDYTCALKGDSSFSCWGANYYGELGNGTTLASSTPLPVSWLWFGTSVSAGWGHTCATLADGTARCWGMGVSGQLGDGNGAGSALPVVVSNYP